MKNTKRILEVKLIRAVDTDPDTSYYGDYANRPNSEFSIDRKHSLECAAQIGNPQTARAKQTLEHVQQTVGDLYNAVLAQYNGTLANDKLDSERDALDDAYIEVGELLDAVEECDCGEQFLDRNSYRYFNPSDNYKGEPDEDVRKYVRQDFERMESYNNQGWHYVGIYATAEIKVGDVLQTIRSGGLWGTESDSDADHFKSIEEEELAELRNQLKALGFSARAISTAFKNVERGDE